MALPHQLFKKKSLCSKETLFLCLIGLYPQFLQFLAVLQYH